MEDASWRRYQGGGITEEGSCIRHLEEASWRRHKGGDITSCTRHLEEASEASGRHLGGILETWAPKGLQG